jgi:hypothetical protein
MPRFEQPIFDQVEEFHEGIADEGEDENVNKLDENRSAPGGHQREKRVP